MKEPIEKRSNWEMRFQRYKDRLQFKEYISRSKQHLDFGCEFGIFPWMLAKKFPKVHMYGFDRDKEKIEIGKKRYILPNLYLFYSPEIVGQYDSITAILSLHETTSPIKTLSDLFQHLNDDGRILVYEFRKTSLEKYKEWFEKGRPNRIFEEEYRKHNRWSINEFEIMCEKIGFNTLNSEPVGDYWLIYIGQK